MASHAVFKEIQKTPTVRKMEVTWYEITLQKEKKREIVLSAPGEKKKLAHATRDKLHGISPNLTDRVRTGFPCKNLQLFLKRRAYEEIRSKTDGTKSQIYILI